MTISTSRDGLSFSFDLADPTPDRLLASVREQDGEVWKDDVVEIFLKPSRRSEVCYHLLVNPVGTLCDIRHEGASKMDLSWNSDATASAIRHSRGWRVTVVIPYSGLGLKELPLPGDIWGLNVTRSRRSSGAEESAWSPTFGLFFRPERFGELIFTGE